MAGLAVAVGVGLSGGLWGCAKEASGPGAAPAGEARGAAAGASAPADGARAALTVASTRPTSVQWARILPANGNVAAWQEASVGAEVGGLRITEVRVNVGDRVKRGQALARLQDLSVAADLAGAKAAVAEAEAHAAEAQSNAERSRQLRDQGFVSPQNVTQTAAAEQAARARLDAQRARLASEQLRLSQTRVLAPDDGVISARMATVGSVVQPGQELFRLIRGGRLEWRAEVTAADLSRVAIGQRATVTLADGQRVEGAVRMVAPTVDASTRNGLVYVDLAAGGPARAGMFARGELHLGSAPALTLPQSAVALREGYSFVFRLGGDGRVTQTKIGVGRREGDRIEVVSGLTAQDAVVASGVGFLADGDMVKVVDAMANPSATAVAASAPGASAASR